jgi:hypothetical protein
LSQGRGAYEILAAAERRKQRLTPLGLDDAPSAPVDGVHLHLNGGANGAVPSYSASLAAKEATLSEIRKSS